MLRKVLNMKKEPVLSKYLGHSISNPRFFHHLQSFYARARSNERFWYWMRRTMLNSVNIKSIVIHTKKKAMLRVTQNEIFFWMVRFCFIFKVFWNLSLGEEEAVVGWSVQVGFYSTYSMPTTKFRLIKCTTAQHIFPNWCWFPIYCYWWQKSS